LASLLSIAIYIHIVSKCDSKQACVDLNSYFAFLPVSYFLSKGFYNNFMGHYKLCAF
jgi:hypothetical protein